MIGFTLGLVSQEATLFPTSILDNVADGLIGTEHECCDAETKRKLVVDACAQANAQDFIKELPHGYDTLLGKFQSPTLDENKRLCRI
jgi:ATP-binding cassette subfamily B (MDR/TAP) protein 1